MRLVAQMDDISTINFNKDSTFVILLEAQNRGHEIFYYTVPTLSYEAHSNNLFALVHKITLNNSQNFYQIVESFYANLSEFDAILVRQDPPFDMNYITATYLLENIQDRVLILNNPSEIRNCPEKIFVSQFPDLIAPTLISSDFEAIKKFHQLHREIILKPLYSFGADGVILIKDHDLNLAAICEMMLSNYKTPIIAQKFIAKVSAGDRRLIMVDGQFVGGIIRLAQAGEIRSNLFTGGLAQKLTPSARELEICEIIGPELKKRNLFLVGIDVIGDYLTEINVTSPTCIQEANYFNGGKIEEIIVQKIEEMLHRKKF